MFTLGYNTNGLAHHRLDESLTLLASMGYGAVAITPDVGQLDPFRCTAREVQDIRLQANDLGLRLVVETGARFLLDPGRKHFPTLLEKGEVERRQRLEFLGRCVDLAGDLGASTVSIWSGVAPEGDLASAPGANTEEVWERLCDGLRLLVEHADRQGVSLAFEPEPGMFIEKPAGYRELLARMGLSSNELGLTLDLGHLVVTGDLPVEKVIAEYGADIRNVHLDDCPAGVHEHRMFGTGDLDLAAAIGALRAIQFEGVASVELSRDSHRGPAAARQAFELLGEALSKTS
jgi:L-ribulose-5-phosphate 3-epimerase